MQKEKRRSTILYSLLATFLLLFASFSFWLYKNIYDSSTFQSHVSKALQTDASRNAIAALIIEEGFKNRPVLKNLLEEQATPILAGILQRPRVQEVMNKLILRVHENLVSTQPKGIFIDLTSIKSMLNNMTYLVEQVTNQERQQIRIPDQIVLIRAGEIPSIAKYGLLILWLGPIAFLTGLGILIWLIVRTVQKIDVLKIIGMSLMVMSLILILLTEWYKPIVLASFANSYSRIVGEQIMDEFLKSLISQTWIFFAVGAALVIAGIAIQRFYPRLDKRPNK